MRGNGKDHVRDPFFREGGSRTSPVRVKSNDPEGVPLRPLRPVPRNERSTRQPQEVRDGGGVYVYRTRKPASLLGLLHAKARTPWWAFPIGAAVACGINAALGYPWWVGLLMLFTSGHHFAYVGETVSFRDRHGEHTRGGGRWKRAAASWSDLDPKCVMRIPLPKRKGLLRFVETFLITLLAPVYNDAKNKWNIRRISRSSARRMRNRRDRRRVKLSLFNIRTAHLLIIVFVWIVIRVVI